MPPPTMTVRVMPGAIPPLAGRCPRSTFALFSRGLSGAGDASRPIRAARAPGGRASGPPASRAEFPHHLYDGADVFHRRFRQDAVAQVEDVARPRAGALQ